MSEVTVPNKKAQTQSIVYEGNQVMPTLLIRQLIFARATTSVRACCILAWTVAVTSSLSFGAEESLLDRFQREAPVQWRKYRELAARSAGNGKRVDHVNRNGKEIDEQVEWSFIIDGQYARIITTSANQQTCRAINPDYRFVITKDNSKWSIRHVKKHSSWQPPADLIGTQPKYDKRSNLVVGDHGPYGLAIQSACQGMTLWTTWLPRMVESSSFKVIRITRDENDSKLVKIAFSYEPTNPEQNDYVRSGVVVLDTGRYWLIRTAEVSGSWGDDEKGVIKVANDYDDGKLPYPIVTRQVEYVSATDGKARSERNTVTTYELYAPTRDASLFTLTAFGLPEPDQLQSTSQELQQPLPTGMSRMQWIALATAVICLAVYFRRRISRSRQGGGA